MVTPRRRALALIVAALTVMPLGAQQMPVPAASSDTGADKKGPVLYGNGGGRIWKWESGQKDYLTPEGLDAVLGGVGKQQLWGWTVAGGLARFFTLQLPKPHGPGGPTANPAPGSAPSAAPVPKPVFDPGAYPIPDRADRVDRRLLLVYGSESGQPRVEVWDGGRKVAAQAWDDGRTVYALSLGPNEGWILAGRSEAGEPWLEVSGTAVEPPEGWRGRLTVALWTAADEKSSPLPHAAGWGAPPGQAPRPLLWGPDGWRQPAPAAPSPDAPPADPVNEPPAGGVYPLLGAAGKSGALSLAGWWADNATGTLRPWFWDGQASQVPGGSADGQPQAFGSGKGGPFLVVRHQSTPWFTFEDGKESVVLEGLDTEDRVGAVEEPADAAASGS